MEYNANQNQPIYRKRAYFSPVQKYEILKEHIEQGIPISILARKHGTNPITIHQWKRTMKSNDYKTPTIEEVKELFKEIDQLKKENKNLKVKVADLSIGNDILKDALDIVKKKELIKQVMSELNSKPTKNTK